MKRLFHIALESPQYSSKAISSAFTNAGFEVTQFNWQQKKFDHGLEYMKGACLAIAEDLNPDVIFVHCQHPQSFDVATMKKLHKIGFTINYTFDVRDNVDWYKAIAPNIGLTIFACHEDVQKLKNSGIKNVAYLPSSCDMETLYTKLNPENRISNHPEIVFIGNNYVGTNLNYPLAAHRQRFIESLQDYFGPQFIAYGMGQRGGVITSTNIERKIYNSCKIAITHNNFIKKGYCSDRDWRAVACGAFTIHHFFDGAYDMFGPSAVLWHEPKDLIFMCEYFLDEEHDVEREELAQSSYNQVVMNHTWTHRVIEIKKLIQQQLVKRILRA